MPISENKSDSVAWRKPYQDFQDLRIFKMKLTSHPFVFKIRVNNLNQDAQNDMILMMFFV
jgi:hypothetical protein